VQKLAIGWTAFVSLTICATAAQADWQSIVWRPAIDAIGNAEPPHLEGIVTIPDGFGFGPDVHTPRGKVTVDDSTTTLPPTVHLRRRKILVIGR
jgi:hypothetical protein